MIATRAPRELLTNMGKHWGGYVIAVRSFHGAIAVARLFAWQVSTACPQGPHAETSVVPRPRSTLWEDRAARLSPPG